MPKAKYSVTQELWITISGLIPPPRAGCAPLGLPQGWVICLSYNTRPVLPTASTWMHPSQGPESTWGRPRVPPRLIWIVFHVTGRRLEELRWETKQGTCETRVRRLP